MPTATAPAPDRGSLPSAVVRSRPEDFQVEEIPAYEPSGQGEHLHVTFRKRGLGTLDAVRALARALGADERGVGFAGMKDRHAVTVQAATFPFPIARNVDQALGSVAVSGVEILGAARHGHKLKPGHLHGNRFRIVLRELDPGCLPALVRDVERLGREGAPNSFGPQRFGRDGDNPERALAWLCGRARGPRGRSEQRLLFSAVQSLAFNRVLARRVSEATWRTIVPGDLAKKTDTGGIFLVPTEGPELDDARLRGEAGLLTPTGPMPGAKMSWPAGGVGELERAVVEELFGSLEALGRHRHLGEGTRRPLVLRVAEARVETDAEAGTATLSFVLPKGGYATTLLGLVCRPVEAAGDATPPEDPGDDPGTEQ